MAPERVFIGLGANLGDARATLREALDDLARLPGTCLLGASSFYVSAPIDAPGPDFVNAVAELATELEPRPLLRALHGIEAAHGRERSARNAPRTLDLDLLLYGQRVIVGPPLTLPHPRLAERAFVLQPLMELAPGLVHPQLGRLADRATQLAAQPLRRWK